VVLLEPWAFSLSSWVPTLTKLAIGKKMYSKNQKISCHFPLEVPGTMVTLVAQIPSSDVIVLDIFDNF